MIHTINTSFATVDAGRQPLASIQNVLQPALLAPAVDKGTVKNISVDAQEFSVHLSTVPSTLRRVLSINRMAGFATVVRRVTRNVSLHRVRTINKSAGREILVRRKASLTSDSSSLASNLTRVRTINKNAGRQILENQALNVTRRNASLTPDSFSDPSSPASNLKRVRTIIKKAGHDILKRRKASLTADSDSIVSDTTTLVDHAVSLKRVRTIVGNVGRELHRRKSAQAVDSPITVPDNSCTPCDKPSYFDIKRAKLGLEVAAPVRRTVLEYPIIYFSEGTRTRIFTEKVSVRNIPVTLPTPDYEVRKITRSIKFADELPEELSVGGRWKRAGGASSL